MSKLGARQTGFHILALELAQVIDFPERRFPKMPTSVFSQGSNVGTERVERTPYVGAATVIPNTFN